MSDLISRQDAIELLRKRLIETANNNVGFTCDAGQVFEDASERIRYWIDELPSSQPEKIYCQDCKYASPNGVYGCRLERFSVHDESIRLFAGDYCSAAERR